MSRDPKRLRPECTVVVWKEGAGPRDKPCIVREMTLRAAKAYTKELKRQKRRFKVHEWDRPRA